MALVQPLPAQVAKIKVIGVGGGGGNAINHMADNEEIKGVDYVAINTDSQALMVSKAKIKIQIGEKLSKGLGAGGNPEIGKKAAEESREKIKKVLEGADMVFIATGLGGGTGTGAAPIIADIAKNELKALTVAIATKPFTFEGAKRTVTAEEGIEKLKGSTDTMITIPNQKLLELQQEDISFVEAFKLADSVLTRGVSGIAEIITIPGLINLDFADIKSIMQNAGSALMGIGFGSGEDRVNIAVEEAINSPLVDLSIEGARGILFNITGGNDISMKEVQKVSSLISENAGGDANIIFGATIDEDYKDKIKITLIATGFDDQKIRLSNLMGTGLPKRPTSSQNFSSKNEPMEKEINEKSEEQPEDINSENDIFSSTNLNKEDIPEGVEIEDPFDIPAFLRKK